MRTILALALGLVLVFALGAYVGQAAGPECPTEDSCTVDYRDGQWQITEVTP